MTNRATLTQHGIAAFVGPFPLDVIENAMHKIGVQSSDWERIGSNIQCVIAKSRFRLPSAGHGALPTQILEAVKNIQEGLEKINDGIFRLDYARKTIGLDAKERDESLEQVQKSCLGAIVEAVICRLPSVRISYESLADSMPSYSENGFSNSWNGAFSLAAARVKNVRESFTADDFHNPTRRQDLVFVTLIGDIADIYTDATGNASKSPNPSGNLPSSWRSAFSQFIADLWPCVGVFGDDENSVIWNATPPSNKRIRIALQKSDILRPKLTV